jgi:hypothetical protein
MGTWGPFPGGEAQPGHDADHSPPSSAEAKNERELYLLFPQAPPWHVARSLYFFFTSFKYEFSSIYKQHSMDINTKQKSACLCIEEPVWANTLVSSEILSEVNAFHYLGHLACNKVS